MGAHLLVFIGVAAIVIVVPGPDTVVVTKNVLVHGRRAALGTSLGVGAGLSVWTCAAAVGVNCPRSLLSRVCAWASSTRLGRFISANVVWKVDPYLLPATRDRVGMGLVLPTALLEARGAKSGAVRDFYVHLNPARLVGSLCILALVAGCGSAGAGPPAPTARVRELSSPVPASVRDPAIVASRTMRLGRSESGRPIDVVRAGDPRGTRVLVVGCIHGNECAGIAVAEALGRTRTRADVWIVPDLNPDGRARDTRQDARGVDLNANWSSQWHGGGRPWDVYYPGPRPFSERETRLARDLIVRIRPRVTIWYHQHMNVVWAWGPSSAAGHLLARAAGMRFYHHPWVAGSAANWQNHHQPGSAAFTVELPAGRLSPQQTRRQVRAVLQLAAATRDPHK